MQHRRSQTFDVLFPVSSGARRATVSASALLLPPPLPPSTPASSTSSSATPSSSSHYSSPFPLLPSPSPTSTPPLRQNSFQPPQPHHPFSASPKLAISSAAFPDASDEFQLLFPHSFDSQAASGPSHHVLKSESSLPQRGGSSPVLLTATPTVPEFPSEFAFTRPSSSLSSSPAPSFHYSPSPSQSYSAPPPHLTPPSLFPQVQPHPSPPTALEQSKTASMKPPNRPQSLGLFPPAPVSSLPPSHSHEHNAYLQQYPPQASSPSSLFTEQTVPFPQQQSFPSFYPSQLLPQHQPTSHQQDHSFSLLPTFSHESPQSFSFLMPSSAPSQSSRFSAQFLPLQPPQQQQPFNSTTLSSAPSWGHPNTSNEFPSPSPSLPPSPPHPSLKIPALKVTKPPSASPSLRPVKPPSRPDLPVIAPLSGDDSAPSPSDDEDVSAVFPSPLSRNDRYECPVKSCSKAYRRRGDLKSHVAMKHRELGDLPELIAPKKSSKQGKTFPCPVETCNCGYMRQHDLSRHLKQKHSE